MRIYVSVDIEGVAGVVHAEQTRRGQHGFDAATRLMTLEANAAALGAFEAGATHVLVNDSHGDMRNLVLELLDPRVEILSGSLKQFSMAEGLEQRGQFDLALFVGYHGGGGTLHAILDHTYSSAVVYEIRINERVMNEASINALVAGHAGTPVGLVTGDASTCTQCQALLGDVLTVPVKWAVSRSAARSLHPEVARTRIREAAERAVRQARSFRPFALPGPFRLEIDMVSTAAVDAAALMPTTERVGPRTIGFESADVLTLFRAMRALIRLGQSGLQ